MKSIDRRNTIEDAILCRIQRGIQWYQNCLPDSSSSHSFRMKRTQQNTLNQPITPTPHYNNTTRSVIKITPRNLAALPFI